MQVKGWKVFSLQVQYILSILCSMMVYSILAWLILLIEQLYADVQTTVVYLSALYLFEWTYFLSHYCKHLGECIVEF